MSRSNDQIANKKSPQKSGYAPLRAERKDERVAKGIDYVKSAEEAGKILLKLMDTPQLISVRFTFEAGINGVPMVSYDVSSFIAPLKEEQAEPQHPASNGCERKDD